MHFYACLMTVAGLLSAAPSYAQLRADVIAGDGNSSVAQAPLIKERPSSFDIGGIKLKMTPAEVIRIAQAKNLKVVSHGTQLRSFEESVDIEMARLQGRIPEFKRTSHTSSLSLSDDGANVWNIDFYSTPSGQRAYNIVYTSPMGGRTGADVYTAAVEKFGPSAVPARISNQFGALWCETTKGPKCVNWGDETSLTLVVLPRELRLELRLDVHQRNQADELVRSTAKLRLSDHAVPNNF